MRYNKVGAAFITKSDTVDNLKGVCAIQATGAGDVVFRHDDGTTSVVIPVTTFSIVPVGRGVVALHSTGTSATNVVAFYGPRE
jgi:hypothetical protein